MCLDKHAFIDLTATHDDLANRMSVGEAHMQSRLGPHTGLAAERAEDIAQGLLHPMSDGGQQRMPAPAEAPDTKPAYAAPVSTPLQMSTHHPIGSPMNTIHALDAALTELREKYANHVDDYTLATATLQSRTQDANTRQRAEDVPDGSGAASSGGDRQEAQAPAAGPVRNSR